MLGKQCQQRKHASLISVTSCSITVSNVFLQVLVHHLAWRVIARHNWQPTRSEFCNCKSLPRVSTSTLCQVLRPQGNLRTYALSSCSNLSCHSRTTGSRYNPLCLMAT